MQRLRLPAEIKSATPMSATIVANGTEILMFDGGPHFKFSPGSSRFVKVPSSH